MPNLSPNFWLSLVVIVFNAGGFVWLARNHFHAVNERLDRIDKRMAENDARIFEMHGQVSVMRTQLQMVVDVFLKDFKH